MQTPPHSDRRRRDSHCNTLKSIFEAEGYVVYEANDGAEMHHILSENDINLVIMDINLPGKMACC